MPSNKNATLRYRTIDNLLCCDEGCTIQELIDACEEAMLVSEGKNSKVSRVTMYKDLEFLGGLEGVSIEKKPGRPVRYRYSHDSKTFNGARVPNQTYSELADTLDYLESINGLIGVDSTIKKIRRQLDGHGRDMQKYICFQNNPRLRNSGMLWNLYRYIREGNPLKMRYDAHFDEVMEIEFQPWYLKQYADRWYLMGWAYKITDNYGERFDVGLRCLAIDRIDSSDEGKPRIDVSRKRMRNVRLNTPGSEGYVDFDEFFSDIVGVTRLKDETPVEIVLRADLESEGRYDWNRLLTKPIHSSQKSWIEGRFGFVSLTVRPNPELYSILLSHSEMEVISPASVRAQLKQRIERLLSHYTEKMR